ncbi:N-acetylglucosamine-6-sulfatase isoform X2 [Ixodes scapularis]
MEILHVFAVLLTVCCSSVPWSNAQPDGKPNILFILADDLDEELGGMKPLLKTRLLLEDGGMQFTNAYVTTPLCCPSRASILTGRYAHNAFVRNNTLAGNCSSTQWQRGTEQLNFAVDLQRAGYETFYAGKYLNQYGHKSAGGVEHVPPGWDSWNALWLRNSSVPSCHQQAIEPRIWHLTVTSRPGNQKNCVEVKGRRLLELDALRMNHSSR